MQSPETVSKLLVDLLARDRTTATINNGILTITQQGQQIALPLNFSYPISVSKA